MLFKGTFNQNYVLFIHPHVVSNLYDFFSSVENTKRDILKTVLVALYN